MDFRQVLGTVAAALRGRGIDFALIGGFALGAHGVARATGDLDLLVDGDGADAAHAVLTRLGYRALHRSPDVANYVADDPALGRLDVLYARRPYSRAMLVRAIVHPVLGRDDVKVIEAEDLIGLKVQASSNDPERLTMDLADIDRLLHARPDLDLERVREYFALFDRLAELEALLARRRRP